MPVPYVKDITAATAVWIALIVGLSVAGSLAFACAAPFAAIAALAATKMRAGEGRVLVVTAWLANQVIGYALFDYPQNFESVAWGAAIGIAAVTGFAAARRVARQSLPEFVRLTVAFGAAFMAYETLLYAATAGIPSGEDAFSLAVVARVFAINAIAFATLVLLHRAAIALHLLHPAGRAHEPAMT